VKAKIDQHSKKFCFVRYKVSTDSESEGKERPTQYNSTSTKETYTGKVSTDSDSEGPLSITFAIYTQNFVPTYARGGPASHFSQFSELCVATSKYVSTWVPDYPNVHVSITFLVCVDLDLGTGVPGLPRIGNSLGLR